ncbi:bifunctional (p)ppGpp synthetase/guanosine-3',5'-bis(diphosphate) 3'-pyrophosphohydrolase [Candidatus Saccharibacteria bacterium]|nr:bifunctional (p)ppGpp synthetase/guanosine-3',5'-bis(diphosphate) 3'-pyrophosphohydrolase [Candidatus Saccharibacteria bacterium]
MKKVELLENASDYYSKDQLDYLERAIDFAIKAHAGQKRESGEPYITHPLTVANTLITWGMDIESVVAGVLHDTVEDTECTLDDIDKKFSHEAALLVDGVTKVSQARSGMRNLESYLPKTRDNLSKLLIAVGQDVRVIIIKLADRLHNLSTLQHLSRERQEKVARESLEVFGPMADRLGMGQVRMQIEEMAFSYLNPHEFKKTQNLMKKRLGKSTRKLGKIRTDVETALKSQNINAEINGRVKSVYSLYKKLAKVGGNIDNVYDLMALRIIVNKKEDCYRVLGILHSMYKPMISRIKDYIATPKPNGYQSLHTTVMTPTEQIVEFQIRTYKMHEFAERGLAAHYNEQKLTKGYIKKLSTKLPDSMKWISRLQEVAEKLKQEKQFSKEQLHIDLFGDRIFVHSPKGDIYDLPEGALPLDFAYLVHSDIARHAYSFKVNNKIHPFDKPLQNGDVVEVVTRKMSQPKQDWLQLVTTTHARSKLQGQLRKAGVIEMITNAAAIIRRKSRKN